MNTTQTSRKIRRKAIQQFEESNKKVNKKLGNVPIQYKRITYPQQCNQQTNHYTGTHHNQQQKQNQQLHLKQTIRSIQTQNTILKKQIVEFRLQLQHQKEVNIKLKQFLTERDEEILRLKNQLLLLQQSSLINREQDNKRRQSQSIMKNNNQQQQFITETLQEIDKLKIKVNELTQQNRQLNNNMSPTQRQQIKDRIIIKLEDQIITLKLLLQEQKTSLSNYYQHQKQFNNHGQNNYSYSNIKDKYDLNYQRYDHFQQKNLYGEQPSTNNQQPYFYH